MHEGVVCGESVGEEEVGVVRIHKSTGHEAYHNNCVRYGKVRLVATPHETETVEKTAKRKSILKSCPGPNTLSRAGQTDTAHPVQEWTIRWCVGCMVVSKCVGGNSMCMRYTHERAMGDRRGILARPICIRHDT